MAEYKHLGYTEFLKVEFMEVSPSDTYRVYAEFSDGTSGMCNLSDLAHLPVFKRASRFKGNGRGWKLDDGCPCWGEDFHVAPEHFKRHLTEMSYHDWAEHHSIIMSGKHTKSLPLLPYP